MIEITSEDIAVAQRPSVWDIGNQVLYDLCRNYPAHSSHKEILAKIWLIGRSYAASIERRKNATQSGDDFYADTVAPTMRNSEIDSWLALASAARFPEDPVAISAHKRLLDLFNLMTGLEKRSLASKYLHFHLPDIFYIYDSRALQAIKRVVPRLRQIDEIKTDMHDREYKDFVRRCAWLRNTIQKQYSQFLTPRQIDNLLLKISERMTKADKPIQ